MRILASNHRTWLLALVLVVPTSFMAAAGSPLDPVGEDEGVEATSAEAPYGLHLSFTEDPQTTMTATWMTAGVEDPGTIARYGPSCTSLDEAAEGDSFQLTLRAALRVHEVTMTGFEPGERFAYEVGGDSGFSDCYETHTAPEEGPFRFALYGDQGLSDQASQVKDHLLQNIDQFDMILIAGDLTYAHGSQAKWNDWLEMNEELFAQVPMMSSPGNHEARTSEGTLDYQEHVAQPGAEIYYSFDYANVHILVVQSHFSQAQRENVLEEMTAFMEADLAEAQQAKEDGEIDHIWIMQHHPLYSNTQGRDINRNLVAWEEHFLHRYDVNLFLAGHNHNYERFYPTAYQVPTETGEGPYVDPAGTVHIITGGGGRALYEFNDPAAFGPFSATHKHAWHYVTLQVDGERIDVEAIQAIDHDDGTPAGHVIDAFTLVDTPARFDLPPALMDPLAVP